MMGPRSIARVLLTLAAVVGILVVGVAPATASPPPVPGPGALGLLYPSVGAGPIARTFAVPGPHRVVTSRTLHPCRDDLYGGLQVFFAPLLGSKDAEKMRCTSAFPHGPDSPIGMLYYRPADLPTDSSAPVMVWAPGLDGDAGQYDATARLWASRGVVVAIPYNFVNSTLTEHFWGTQQLVAEASRPGSPIFRRVDLGRVVIGGHSGGAGSLIWAASYLPALEKRIDPRLHIIGALSVATGINGPVGAAISIPTLTVTGTRDFVTPPFLWPYWAYATITRAPAWIAPVVNAGHTTVNDALPNNPVAGLSMAWIAHLVGGSPAADAIFVGPDWSLRHDPAFIDVQRNAAAAHLHRTESEGPR